MLWNGCSPNFYESFVKPTGIMYHLHTERVFSIDLRIFEPSMYRKNCIPKPFLHQKETLVKSFEFHTARCVPAETTWEVARMKIWWTKLCPMLMKFVWNIRYSWMVDLFLFRRKRNPCQPNENHRFDQLVWWKYKCLLQLGWKKDVGDSLLKMFHLSTQSLMTENRTVAILKNVKNPPNPSSMF